MKPKNEQEDVEIEEDIGDLETGLMPSLANERRQPAAPRAQQPAAAEEEDPDQVPTGLLELPPQLAPAADPQKRIVTPPMGLLPLASSEGEKTEPEAAPLRRSQTAEVAQPTRSLGRKIFAGLLKGGIVAALMLGAAWISRVATIAEIRQELAEKDGPGSKPVANVPRRSLARIRRGLRQRRSRRPADWRQVLGLARPRSRVPKPVKPTRVLPLMPETTPGPTRARSLPRASGRSW